ncbi:VOC family protein [Solibacillus sp. FSL K6-1523]|uniref:VOC family protein n=1 Tax=Solibacillus sp. FSL K6-1523 TaxID=2921471 RepID=UPI0030FC2075
MSLQFDHFVHLTADPKKAIETFQAIGLHAVEGGKHENLGTYNALSYFGLSYVELIGIFDEALVKTAANIKYSLRDTFIENQLQQGPQRIALRSNNLTALAEHFRSLGLEVNGPSDFSRTRPDGTLVTWKLLFAGKPSDSITLPFFIQWDENDNDRHEDLQQRGVIAPHEIGDISVDGAAFAVQNLEQITSLWQEILQLDKGLIYEDKEWNAKAQRLSLQGGDIIFYEPLGEGTVQEIINSKGEGLFALQFKGSDPKITTISNAIYRFI